MISVLSLRVPAADQMVPGPAAFRPAYPGANCRPPLDEGNNRITQITRGAGRRWHTAQDHRHRLFIKHKLKQGEPLRMALMDWKRLSGETRGGDGGNDMDSRPAACSPVGPSVSGHLTQLVRQQKCTLIFLFCREFLIYYCLFFLILFSPIPSFFLSVDNICFLMGNILLLGRSYQHYLFPPLFNLILPHLLLGWYMQARPSYSDMAALIELGENPFLFKWFCFDFGVPFFRKLLFWWLSSTTVFGFAHGMVVKLPVLWWKDGFRLFFQLFPTSL